MSVPCPRCMGTGVLASATVTKQLRASLTMRRCGCVKLTRREFNAITDTITAAFTREYNRRLPEVLT